MKIINGCEEDSSIGEKWLVSNYKLKRCPIKEITQEGLEYLEAYRFYKNGVLPLPGGWLNQAQTFITAMKLIETEIHNIEKLSKVKANA